MPESALSEVPSLACARWMEARAAELLPVEYFHVVFTLPSRLGPLALQNPRMVYGTLFRAAAETMLQLGADPKYLGADIGFFAVLHTWGQNLHLHPHVHCVVPGGGMAADRSRWIACRPGFFLPVAVMRRLFRGKFLALFQDAYRNGRLSFHGQQQAFANPARFVETPGFAAANGVGCLCQAAVWRPTRPRAGAQVSGALHPSRRHLQPSPAQNGGR